MDRRKWRRGRGLLWVVCLFVCLFVYLFVFQNCVPTEISIFYSFLTQVSLPKHSEGTPVSLDEIAAHSIGWILC